MSKERARRRAEREAEAQKDRERRARQRARRDCRDTLLRPFAAPFRSRRRPDSALTRARQKQDGILLAGLAALHFALWLLTPSWWLRGSALVLTLLLWPLLTVLIFDRRPTR